MYNLSTYTQIYVKALYRVSFLSFYKGKVLNAVCNQNCVGLMFIERL